MEQINKQTWVGTKEKFLQLPEIETNKSYYITDLASFGISSEDMELATSTEASLYDIDSIFICFNEGTYKKGHIYKFSGNGWEDISYAYTEEDKVKVEKIIIDGDGNKFLSDDGAYKEIENRTETLSGTAESPLNLKTLELGKLYLISGIFSKKQNSTIDVGTTRQVLMRVNSIRNDIKEKEIVIYGMYINSSGYGFSNDYVCNYTIDSDTGYSKGYYNNYTMISYLNGKLAGGISLYAPTTAGSQGQLLQSNGSSNAPTWIDMPSTGPGYLNGTAEAPINLYNDLEVNKLYLISGIIYNSDNNLTANDSILTYKTNTNSLYLIGAKIDLIENEIYFQPGYFTLAEIEATGEISTYQTSIAPVNSGTPGQVLTSNGPDEAPTWQNSSATTLSNGTAHLSLTSGEGDVAHLTCDKPLYVGSETQDLTFDCHTLQIMTEDGWAIQSYVTNEDEEDSGSFTFQFGNITLANSNQAIHLNKASDQIILQAGAIRSNGTNTDLGTSDMPWNNIYANNIYQNGSKVLTQNDIALYKHNVSLNGTSDSGKKINARVVCLTRSNVLITTYGQLVNSITGAVDYPINGYVYDENDNFFGTIIYFDYNVGNIFEFTVAAPTGIETISLSTAQITIADTAVLVE